MKNHRAHFFLWGSNSDNCIILNINSRRSQAGKSISLPRSDNTITEDSTLIFHDALQCVSINIFWTCLACLDFGKWHCEPLLWNNVGWTVGDKWTLNSWQMQTLWAFCFCSSVAEVSVFLWYYTLSLGNRFLILLDDAVVSSTSKDETITLPCNIRN
jgi:hypothetical protein